MCYLYGTMIATLSLAVQLGGKYLPPQYTSGNRFSTSTNSISVLFTGTGPEIAKKPAVNHQYPAV